MQILHGCSPFMLEPVIKSIGKDIVNLVANKLLNSTPEKIRDFSKELIDNASKALGIVAMRTEPKDNRYKLSEQFMVDIAIICTKSDYLDKKLYGVSLLSNINKKLTTRMIFSYTKKDLVIRLKEEDILSGILKGHP